VYEFRLDKNNDKQNTNIKKEFFWLLIEELKRRPESGLLNTQQLHWLANAASRFSDDKSQKQSFEFRMDSNDIRALGESICSRVLRENLGPQTDASNSDNYLFALGSFIHYSKYLISFRALTLDQLVLMAEDLRSTEQNQTTARASIGEREMLSSRVLSTQIEEGILSQLGQTSADSIDEKLVLRLKALYREVGAKPNSVGQSVLIKLIEGNQNEGLDSYWWEPLTLRDLLLVMKQNLDLGHALVAAAKSGTWFATTVEKHVHDSDSLQDLAIGLEAAGIFGSPSARELTRIWMSVALKSPVLHEIEQGLVDTPVKNMKASGEKRLAQASATHQLEIEALNEEIVNLRASISTLEATMQRGRENLGDTKAGLESGISRKYGEAIARVIRRLEREAGKAPFQDIIAKESSGLGRLGISLLLSGTTQPFEPAIHDSVGQNLKLGSNVTIIETGVLLLLGKDTITLLKAVVRPAE
jgi:hypothetical protein